MPFCHLEGCTPVPRTSATDVVRDACSEWGVSVELVTGPGRAKELVRARRALALRLRDLGLSLSEIGVQLGGRHHTTVMSVLRGGKHKASNWPRLVAA
jgi:chromosomal replication initiation ATPase DnaA